jgi:hypothetical protein
MVIGRQGFSGFGKGGSLYASQRALRITLHVKHKNPSKMSHMRSTA